MTTWGKRHFDLNSDGTISVVEKLIVIVASFTVGFGLVGGLLCLGKHYLGW